MSLIGDIVFRRQKQRCLWCGKERYLLDEALGIARRRLVTSALAEVTRNYERIKIVFRKLRD